MAGEEVCKKSSAIFSKIYELKEFEAARLIMCYMDFRNEVETADFIRECIKRGKRIVLPLVKKNGVSKEMFTYEVENLENDMHIGTYGILEPIPERTVKVEAADIDLVIIPGVVFDYQKHRIGYGAGYYDRFLGRVKPSCKKLAVAFDIQLMDKIPSEVHDITMDLIITESHIIK